MDWWEIGLEALVILLVLVAVPLAALFARRRWIGRGGGTFDMSILPNPQSLPTPAARSRKWTLGIGRYNGDDIEWFRTFGLRLRPHRVFTRPLEIEPPRVPTGVEAYALYSGHVVIDVRTAQGGSFAFAMSDSALTGLQAWLEAAPPGTRT